MSFQLKLDSVCSYDLSIEAKRPSPGTHSGLKYTSHRPFEEGFVQGV